MAVFVRPEKNAAYDINQSETKSVNRKKNNPEVLRYLFNISQDPVRLRPIEIICRIT
jgi:hypothetical protein